MYCPGTVYSTHCVSVFRDDHGSVPFLTQHSSAGRGGVQQRLPPTRGVAWGVSTSCAELGLSEAALSAEGRLDGGADRCRCPHLWRLPLAWEPSTRLDLTGDCRISGLQPHSSLIFAEFYRTATVFLHFKWISIPSQKIWGFYYASYN